MAETKDLALSFADEAWNGYKLYNALNVVNVNVTRRFDAPEIENIARDVDITTAALQRLMTLITQDNVILYLSQESIEYARSLTKQCGQLFNDIYLSAMKELNYDNKNEGWLITTDAITPHSRDRRALIQHRRLVHLKNKLMLYLNVIELAITQASGGFEESYFTAKREKIRQLQQCEHESFGELKNLFSNLQEPPSQSSTNPGDWDVMLRAEIEARSRAGTSAGKSATIAVDAGKQFSKLPQRPLPESNQARQGEQSERLDSVTLQKDSGASQSTFKASTANLQKTHQEKEADLGEKTPAPTSTLPNQTIPDHSSTSTSTLQDQASSSASTLHDSTTKPCERCFQLKLDCDGALPCWDCYSSGNDCEDQKPQPGEKRTHSAMSSQDVGTELIAERDNSLARNGGYLELEQDFFSSRAQMEKPSDPQEVNRIRLRDHQRGIMTLICGVNPNRKKMYRVSDVNLAQTGTQASSTTPAHSLRKEDMAQFDLPSDWGDKYVGGKDDEGEPVAQDSEETDGSNPSSRESVPQPERAKYANTNEEEEPLFVNPKQFDRIVKQRMARQQQMMREQNLASFTGPPAFVAKVSEPQTGSSETAVSPEGPKSGTEQSGTETAGGQQESETGQEDVVANLLGRWIRPEVAAKYSIH
ncbi:hypothetical protein BU24DRAFT_493210 [Aaosphaeria arxii CBS 175.79]|uniref:Uncharacterized protein n=1 Tax=Aaosphaeria arxii CBS 175.79 TaxID=1450172 RepID=A0A6A5XQT0_9PLEO|nr:uncharacterized protein BU24DRAFT_493210 [Aaosphaeria arxii CBS 175.79]KAF2014654.1 hypothetical protein BU24DRAFT_493210 [Aaosphaeria arxii CBS 175.79]